MRSWDIFYVCSILVSIYTFYLFAFRTYKAKNRKKTEERVLYPNIVYLLTFISSFIPIGNLILSVGFYIAVFVEERDEFVVDSWLFKKPGEK